MEATAARRQGQAETSTYESEVLPAVLSSGTWSAASPSDRKCYQDGRSSEVIVNVLRHQCAQTTLGRWHLPALAFRPDLNLHEEALLLREKEGHVVSATRARGPGAGNLRLAPSCVQFPLCGSQTMRTDPRIVELLRVVHQAAMTRSLHLQRTLSLADWIYYHLSVHLFYNAGIRGISNLLRV